MQFCGVPFLILGLPNKTRAAYERGNPGNPSGFAQALVNCVG